MLKVKIKDIAKETGYSITTVSKAFNGYKDVSEEAKKTILEAARRMGYMPNAHARSLAMNRSYTIGVIFDEQLGYGIRHPFFGAVIEYFKEEVEKAGYDLLFISKSIHQTNVHSYLDHCRQRGVDGVFLPNAEFETEEIKELLLSDIPKVSVETSSGRTNAVNSNDFEGMQEIVNYLIGLGHRRIAHICSNMDEFAGIERKKGYEAALRDHKLEIRDDYIVRGHLYSYESGYECMEQLLSLEDLPTAVAVTGDMMALGAIKAIQDKGLRCPEDISVTGYDNLDILKYMTPGLTTVGQNTQLIGRKAAELLLNQIKDPLLPCKEIIINTRLFVRESCAELSEFQ